MLLSWYGSVGSGTPIPPAIFPSTLFLFFFFFFLDMRTGLRDDIREESWQWKLPSRTAFELYTPTQPLPSSARTPSGFYIGLPSSCVRCCTCRPSAQTCGRTNRKEKTKVRSPPFHPSSDKYTIRGGNPTPSHGNSQFHISLLIYPGH